MKERIPGKLSSLALVTFLFFISIASGADLRQAEEFQEDVRGSTIKFTRMLRELLTELESLGASSEDVTLVRSTLAKLQRVNTVEVDNLLEALRTLDRSPQSVNRSDLVERQAEVELLLEAIQDRLLERELELNLQERAARLREQQLALQHATAMLGQGVGDRVRTVVEQRALRAEIDAFADEIEVIDAAQYGTVSAGLREWIGVVVAQIEASVHTPAYQAQGRVIEILADLAGETPPPANAGGDAPDLLALLRGLRERQATLAADVSWVYGAQEQAALDGGLLVVPVESINAAAGVQVASAVDAMRGALVAKVSGGAGTAEQTLALTHLDRAIALLEVLQPPENSEGSSGGSDAFDDADAPDTEGQSGASSDDAEARDALREDFQTLAGLQQAQANINASESPNAQAQAALARQTAELQASAAESAPESARHLGRAAARMAEALDERLDAESRQALREEASRQLAQASEAMVATARNMQSAQANPTGDLETMDAIEIADDLLGEQAWTPEERAVLEVGRREPVSGEYAPLVEAYFERLSRDAEEGGTL